MTGVQTCALPICSGRETAKLVEGPEEGVLRQVLRLIVASCQTACDVEHHSQMRHRLRVESRAEVVGHNDGMSSGPIFGYAEESVNNAASPTLSVFGNHSGVRGVDRLKRPGLERDVEPTTGLRRNAMRVIALLLFLGVWSAPAGAQSRVDVGLLLGSTKASDEGTALQFDRATTYQATFAWRVWQNDAVRVSIEVPFIASPAFDVTTAGRSLQIGRASCRERV